MSARKSAAISALLILLMFAASAVTVRYMPVQYGPPGSIAANPAAINANIALLYFIPVLTAVLWLIIAAAPWVFPLGRNLLRSPVAYSTTWIATTAIFAVVQGWQMSMALGVSWPHDGLVFGAIGVTFMVLGNVYGKALPNTLVGAVTPWALADDVVWNKTQRVGGRAMVVAGFVLLVSAFLFDRATLSWMVVVLPGGVGAGTMVQSYLFWRDRRRERLLSQK